MSAKSRLSVDVRRSETSLLKLAIIRSATCAPKCVLKKKIYIYIENDNNNNNNKKKKKNKKNKKKKNKKKKKNNNNNNNNNNPDKKCTLIDVATPSDKDNYTIKYKEDIKIYIKIWKSKLPECGR